MNILLVDRLRFDIIGSAIRTLIVVLGVRLKLRGLELFNFIRHLDDIPLLIETKVKIGCLHLILYFNIEI